MLLRWINLEVSYAGGSAAGQVSCTFIFGFSREADVFPLSCGSSKFLVCPVRIIGQLFVRLLNMQGFDR